MSTYVICVGILYSGNLGAIARLCSNFGVEKLILVKPECEIDKEAYDRATHGKYYLDDCIIVDSLIEAKKYVDLLIALSARKGGKNSLARSSISLEEYFEKNDFGGKVGFVLGRENWGLSNEETDLCDLLVHIPIKGDNVVLNISHALSIVLWEQNKLNEEEIDSEKRLMTREEKDAFMMMLNDILSHVWIEEDKHYGMKRVFSMIIGRSMVTSREANTLIGTLRGIRRSLEGPHPPWDKHE